MNRITGCRTPHRSSKSCHNYSLLFGILTWLGLILLVPTLQCADSLPARPRTYVTDPGNALSGAARANLERQLQQFERQTSSQIVVAVFDKLPEGAALEDFTHRTFQSWRVGQREKNNGAALFVFVRDRKLRIEVGYGLEGAIPDALASQIIEETVVPRFRANDFDGGIVQGVDALLRAARGEYRGDGRTAGDRRKDVPPSIGIPVLIAIIFLALWIRKSSRNGTLHRRPGSLVFGGPRHWGRRGGSGSSGGFSGGGGRSGGGGASGRW